MKYSWREDLPREKLMEMVEASTEAIVSEIADRGWRGWLEQRS